MTTKEKIEAAAKRHWWSPKSLSEAYEYGYQAGAEFGIALERERSAKLVEQLKRWPHWLAPAKDNTRIDYEFVMKMLADYESEEG
jgi:hypothetical protein